MRFVLRSFLLLLILTASIHGAASFWQSRDSNFNKNAVTGGGGRTCTDGTHAAAFNARLTGSPSNTLQDAYCNFINGLDTDSLFALADGVYIFATNTTANSLLNLVSTSCSLTATGTPTFNANSGYDGTASALLTGCDPTTDSGVYAQTSASVFIWNLTTYTSGVDYGPGAGQNRAGTSSVSVYSHFSDDNFYAITQSVGVALSTASISAAHFEGWSRTGTTAVDLVQGTSISTQSNLFSVVVSGPFVVLADYSAGSPRYSSSAKRTSFWWYGSGLNSTQYGNLCHRVYVFMNTIAGATGSTC